MHSYSGSLLIQLHSVEDASRNLECLLRLIKDIGYNGIGGSDLERLGEVLVFLADLGAGHLDEVFNFITKARVALMARPEEGES